MNDSKEMSVIKYPKAMSQMAAMKMLDFYQKRLTEQEIMMHLPIVAFPLFLQHITSEI